jgi:hypothetical protein
VAGGSGLGETFYSIGLIEGGVAPERHLTARAGEVMFRLVGSPDDVLRQAKTLEPDVTIEEVLRVPTVRLHTIPGVPSAVFPVHHRYSAPGQLGDPVAVRPGFVPRRAHRPRASRRSPSSMRRSTVTRSS